MTGSYQLGLNTVDSDIDCLVVLPHGAGKDWKALFEQHFLGEKLINWLEDEPAEDIFYYDEDELKDQSRIPPVDINHNNQNQHEQNHNQIAQGYPALPLHYVPTSHEQGLPEFDCAPFYAVFAPKGTPKPIVDKLAEALNKGLDEEAVRKRLTDLGAEIAEPHRRGPKALGDLVRSEVARLTPILKAAAAK